MSNITYPCPDYTLSDLQKVDDTKAYCSTCKKNVHLNNPGADVYCGTEKPSSQYLNARQFTMRFLVVLVLGFGPSLFCNLYAQTDNAGHAIVDSVQNRIITGTVMEKETGEPLPFVVITLEYSGKLIAKAMTDFDGMYKLSIPSATHNYQNAQLHFKSIGYDDSIIELDSVKSQITHINATLKEDEDLILVGIIISEPPLFDRSPDGLRQTTIKRDDIQRMPVGR